MVRRRTSASEASEPPRRTRPRREPDRSRRPRPSGRSGRCRRADRRGRQPSRQPTAAETGIDARRGPRDGCRTDRRPAPVPPGAGRPHDLPELGATARAQPAAGVARHRAAVRGRRVDAGRGLSAGPRPRHPLLPRSRSTCSSRASTRAPCPRASPVDADRDRGDQPAVAGRPRPARRGGGRSRPRSSTVGTALAYSVPPIRTRARPFLDRVTRRAARRPAGRLRVPRGRRRRRRPALARARRPSSTWAMATLGLRAIGRVEDDRAAGPRSIAVRARPAGRRRRWSSPATRGRGRASRRRSARRARWSAPPWPCTSCCRHGIWRRRGRTRRQEAAARRAWRTFDGLHLMVGPGSDSCSSATGTSSPRRSLGRGDRRVQPSRSGTWAGTSCDADRHPAAGHPRDVRLERRRHPVADGRRPEPRRPGAASSTPSGAPRPDLCGPTILVVDGRGRGRRRRLRRWPVGHDGRVVIAPADAAGLGTRRLDPADRRRRGRHGPGAVPRRGHAPRPDRDQDPRRAARWSDARTSCRASPGSSCPRRASGRPCPASRCSCSASVPIWLSSITGGRPAALAYAYGP